MNMQTARIHRFRDDVAIDFNGTDSRGDATGTETIYLSASQARDIAAKLVQYADDINSVSFSDSQTGTCVL